MKKPEILAPVGSAEALTAALRCGADAVYLGTQRFNARRSASNFEEASLEQTAFLCHTHGAKLYLTLNTLASDAETDDLRRTIASAAAAGVDALIVQDMGVARLARESCDVPLHASTQTSVQTAEGVAVLRDMGFSRVVVPRELRREELSEIREKTDLEIETFVHGALCMCVSGQCLLSAVFGGRSGNRGLCAQPCRLPFAAPGGTGHDLSLKDLSLLPYLRELRDLGIDSFKIEGRMKRPEYVAAAVTACRAALDGADDSEIFELLRRVFSRSGFTDGYYTGNLGRSMFGTRQKEDVTAAQGALQTLGKLYETQTPRYPVTFSFVCRAREPVQLTAASGDYRVTVQGEKPASAQNRATDAAAVRKQLQKCGGTLFSPETIQIELDDGLFLPASALNALRRDALDGLLQKIGVAPEYTYHETKEPHLPHEAGRRKLFVRFADESQIPEGFRADRIILPLYCGAGTVARYGAAVEIPRGLFGRAQEVREKLHACREAGVREATFASLDGLALAKECGLAPIAGFGSNVFNTLSLCELEAHGVSAALVSPELALSAARDLGGDLPRGVFVYGRLPLMLMRNCPQKNGKTCRECQRSGELTDRKGVTFPIECRSGCAELLNDRPVYLLDKQKDIRNADFALVYFTTETAAECADILRAYGTCAEPTGSFTRGLAFKGVE